MRIGCYCKYGEILEIGTGHYYRTKWILSELTKRGHECFRVEASGDWPGMDLLLIDHLAPQTELISRAKKANIKVALIDGVAEDVKNVDLSISPHLNPEATYTGLDYMVCLPRTPSSWYNQDATKVLVSMGGFDANNYAAIIVEALKTLELDIVLTRSINHQRSDFPGIEIYEGEDYYNPMAECQIGIVNGGLTFFQALHFGLPVIAVPQYDHQAELIKLAQRCCLAIEDTRNLKKEIISKVIDLQNNPLLRYGYSANGQKLIDGKAIARISDLIEGMK
jgi:spore coat polysaccharide biosynthesis predicted glycosyltransferase SpsG